MKNKRLYYIDVLNCIAIIFVLFLHSTQLAHVGNSNFSHYRLSLVVQSLCIPAVYIFFMNSGATLLDYRSKYSTKLFFKKRFHRVLIPFLIWSVVYYLYELSHDAYPATLHHPHPGLRDFIIAFLNNDINYLFWFFYSIIGLYLITPVISFLVKDHLNTLLYMVIVFFICNDVLQYISHLTKINFSTSFVSQPLISSSFVGYFIMGYLIKINYFNDKWQWIFIIAGVVVLVLSLINDYFYGHIRMLSHIGPFPYSMGLYIWIKQKVEFYDQTKLKKFATLSGASLGIYILHPFVYELLDKYLYGATPGTWSRFLILMNNPLYMASLPILSYGILVIIVLMLKRVKFLKILIP